LIISNEKLNLKAAGLILLTSILWGGNALTIKIGLAGIPPLSIAGFRFVLGGLAVLIWVLVLRIPLGLRIKEVPNILILGILFVVQICAMNLGIQRTLAGRSSVLISTYPFFASLLAHFFIPGDRLSPLKFAGMILSFCGVVLIFAEGFAVGNLQSIPGDIIVLVSTILLATRMIFIKRISQNMHPGKLLLWQAIFGVPVFFILSYLLEGSIVYKLDWRIVAAVLYQGLVVAGFGFIVNTTMIRRYIVSGVTVFSFFTPVSGVLLSNLILGEPITVGLIVSLLLVATGVTMVNWFGNR
jgi:drug/metabolite transporter (DMT)-like permease